MVSNIKIGEFIRAKRKELNLSQKDLADRLNISFQAVSKWETGEALPDVSLLLDLADILNTTTDRLLSGGQIVLRSNKIIQVQNIIEGFNALDSLREYFGPDSLFYQGAISGINKIMNIDFESYMKNDHYRETMLAEAIIQYLLSGYQIMKEDIDEHVNSTKLRGLIYKYMGDNNTIKILKFEENPNLFNQIRAIKPEFAKLERLNELPGEYIRMEPGKLYWGTQIETNQDYCYGIAVDEKNVYVFTYEANGVNQKLVHKEKIK